MTGKIFAILLTMALLLALLPASAESPADVPNHIPQDVQVQLLDEEEDETGRTNVIAEVSWRENGKVRLNELRPFVIDADGNGAELLIKEDGQTIVREDVQEVGIPEGFRYKVENGRNRFQLKIPRLKDGEERFYQDDQGRVFARGINDGDTVLIFVQSLVETTEGNMLTDFSEPVEVVLTKENIAARMIFPVTGEAAEEGGNAAGEEPMDGVFALMTIPYDLFYAAETTGGQYDSVTSATCVKPLMMTYVGGSFHFMPDGREITGVIFPVYAESEALLAEYGGMEITDESSVTITVNDNGKEITTTYTGKDALFESWPFSYYRLDEVPPVYKKLGRDSTFGPMEGLVVEIDGTISVVSDPYAEICLQVEGVDDVLTDLHVNGVVLVAEDGTRVGMKHLENIWQKTFFGFNLDSAVYALLKGKGIVSVELYTHEAKYVIHAGEAVKID